MKMAKKYSALMVCAAVSLSLAACGPKESSSAKSSSKGAELVVWEDKEKSIGITDAVAAFEKEHDVKVKVVEKPYAKQIEDLRMDGLAGTGPDVLTMPGDQIGTAVTEGLLKELHVEKNVQSLYTDASIQSQMVDQKLYGLPKAVETTVLFYNKDLISEKELPQTLEEWYDYSKKTADGSKFGFLALFDQIYYAESVMSGSVDTFSERTKTAAITRQISESIMTALSKVRR